MSMEKITTNFLLECEEDIANGETEKALKRLYEVKEETGYKREILTLNNRFKKYARQLMNRTISE